MTVREADLRPGWNWVGGLVVAMACLVSANALADDRMTLRGLMAEPASAFTVGMLNLGRLVDSVEDRLWEYTYDLSDYGDEEDSYVFRYDGVNYRYGRALLNDDGDAVLMTGMVLARGKYLNQRVCVAVMREMRVALFEAAGLSREAADGPVRFVSEVFPLMGADGTGGALANVLDNMVIEIRMYEELPSREPDAVCSGHLHHDVVAFASR